MNSLQNYLQEFDPSLADRIERLSRVIENSSPEKKASFRKEVSEWIRKSDKESLAAGIAGSAKLDELAPILYERLQTKGFTAGDYNRILVSLGMLDYTPASDYIAGNFLQEQTRAAALVALMTIDPEKTKKAFEVFANKNPEECAAIAEIGLLQCYTRKGIEQAKTCLSYIPSEVKSQIPKYLCFPKELTKACEQ